MTLQPYPPAPTRFDLHVMSDLPFLAAERFGDRVAFRHRDGDDWRDRSFADVAAEVEKLAAGLVAAGVAPRDRVCILANSRPEWSRAALAVLAIGAAVVPVYPTSSPQECAWILGDSGAVMLIVENTGQLERIGLARDAAPALRTVLTIEDGPSHAEASANAATSAACANAANSAAVATLDQVAARGGREEAEAARLRRAAVVPDEPCMIIYTSGTTGPAKGCVLTHRNFVAGCKTAAELGYFSPDDVVYLFLPLAHMFGQMMQFGALYFGSTLAFFGGDIQQVVAELAEVRPTLLPSVPRVFEKIHAKMGAFFDTDQVAEAMRASSQARELRRLGLPLPDELRSAQTAAYDLLAPVRAVFGGRLRLALSGTAPISPDVLDFFQAAGVPVLEGYGMTESTGFGSVNRLDDNRVGTVGTVSPGLELKISEDSEILMRGPHVFTGYWDDPNATAEVLRDGWLHTGDLGTLDPDGFLSITGRRKDVIITAGGKNIAPAVLENLLRQSPWISHTVSYGDRRPYLVTLVTLDEEEIRLWARERGLPADLTTLAAHPQVHELIGRIIDTANERVARPAQIKRFTILARELSQDAGELTATGKIRRAAVHRNHAARYEALYQRMKDPLGLSQSVPNVAQRGVEDGNG